MNIAIAILLTFGLTTGNPKCRTTVGAGAVSKLGVGQSGKPSNPAGGVGSPNNGEATTATVARAPQKTDNFAAGKIGYPIPSVADDPLCVRLRDMIVKFNKRLSQESADAFAQWITYYGREKGFEPALLASLIARESSFNPDAVSATGARGLGQLTAGTARDMGVMDPCDPEENIRGTASYLAKLLAMWKDRPDQVECAVASYLVGHRVVQDNNGVPPNEAVGKFVNDVLVNCQSLNELPQTNPGH